MAVHTRIVKSAMFGSQARVNWFTDSPIQKRIVIETGAGNEDTGKWETVTMSLSLDEAGELASFLHEAITAKTTETNHQEA